MRSKPDQDPQQTQPKRDSASRYKAGGSTITRAFAYFDRISSPWQRLFPSYCEYVKYWLAIGSSVFSYYQRITMNALSSLSWGEKLRFNPYVGNNMVRTWG